MLKQDEGGRVRIYLITNLNNGKYCVGKTVKSSLIIYLNNVFSAALKGKNNRPLLHRSVRKHGKCAFVIEQLSVCDTNTQASDLERLWIIALNSRKNDTGYNLSAGGEGSVGVKHSPEVRKRWSEARKGRTPWNKGKRYALRSKPEDYMQGENNPFFGKHHAIAAREAVAESNRKRVWSVESRERMRVSTKMMRANVPFSAAALEKMRISAKTRQRSEDGKFAQTR